MLINLALFFIIALLWSSLFEWLLHKYVMHRPFLGSRYAFNAHAIVHHPKFAGDKYCSPHSKEDMEKIPMAWWNGPVLIVIATLPAVFVSWICDEWMLSIVVVSVMTVYFLLYEGMHYLMHDPKDTTLIRWVKSTKVFKFLDKHHFLHHEHPRSNFNVVFPFWDWFLGTLIRE